MAIFRQLQEDGTLTAEDLKVYNELAKSNERRRALLRKKMMDTEKLATFSITKFNRWGASLKRDLRICAQEGSEALIFSKGDEGAKRFPFCDIKCFVRNDRIRNQLTIMFKGKSNRDYKIDFDSEDSLMMACTLCKLIDTTLHVRYESESEDLGDAAKAVGFRCEVDGVKTILEISVMHSKVVFRTMKRGMMQSLKGNETNDSIAITDDLIMLPVMNENSSLHMRVVGNHPRAHRTGGKTSWHVAFASPKILRRFQKAIRLSCYVGSSKTGNKSKDVSPQALLDSATSRLSIFTGTFNVGESSPSKCKCDPKTSAKKNGLRSWFGSTSDSSKVGSERNAGAYYDVVAVGLQECSKKDDWIGAMQSYFEEVRRGKSLPKQTHEMVVLHVGVMRSIVLVVFVRRELVARISCLCEDQVAAGGRQVVGVTVANKGATMCAFRFDGSTSLCFVSCHLPARAERLAKRNRSYAEICGALRVQTHHAETVESGGEKNQGTSIFSCDHIFWVGDFNYRIDCGQGGTPGEFRHVVRRSQSGRWRELQRNDQLLREMRGMRSFVGFQEGALRFPPTYRRERDIVKGFSNKRNQNPSYPDRVLYRSLPLAKDLLHQNGYWSARELLGSDHRPVGASFQLRTGPPVSAADFESARTIGKRDHVLGHRCSIEMSRAFFFTMPHIDNLLIYDDQKLSVAPGSDVSKELIRGALTRPCPCVKCGQFLRLASHKYEIVRGRFRPKCRFVPPGPLSAKRRVLSHHKSNSINDLIEELDSIVGTEAKSPSGSLSPTSPKAIRGAIRTPLAGLKSPVDTLRQKIILRRHSRSVEARALSPSTPKFTHSSPILLGGDQYGSEEDEEAFKNDRVNATYPLYLICAKCAKTGVLLRRSQAGSKPKKKTPKHKLKCPKDASDGHGSEWLVGIKDACDDATEAVSKFKNDFLDGIGDDEAASLVFSASYLDVGATESAKICQSEDGEGPFRFSSTNADDASSSLVWNWKSSLLPSLSSSVGILQWVARQHLQVSVRVGNSLVGNAHIPLSKLAPVRVQLRHVGSPVVVSTPKHFVCDTPSSRVPVFPRSASSNSRNGKAVELMMKRDGSGKLGIKFDNSLRVLEVSEWAKSQGLKVGHRIVACRGKPVATKTELVNLVPMNDLFSLKVIFESSRAERIPPVKERDSSSGRGRSRSSASAERTVDVMVFVYHRGRVVGALVLRYGLGVYAKYESHGAFGMIDPLLDEAEWCVANLAGEQVKSKGLTEKGTGKEKMSQLVINRSEKLVRSVSGMMRRMSTKSNDPDNAALHAELALLRDENASLRSELETTKMKLATCEAEIRDLRSQAELGYHSAPTPSGLRRRPPPPDRPAEKTGEAVMDTLRRYDSSGKMT